MGAALGKVDDKKIQMGIDKGFAHFDTNKNGFIEGTEAMAAARKALKLVGPLGAKVTDSMLEGAFNKFAGADKRLDKAEFSHAVHALLEKVGGPKAHGTTAATATHGTAPATAAAAADHPVAAH